MGEFSPQAITDSSSCLNQGWGRLLELSSAKGQARSLRTRTPRGLHFPSLCVNSLTHNLALGGNQEGRRQLVREVGDSYWSPGQEIWDYASSWREAGQH